MEKNIRIYKTSNDITRWVFNGYVNEDKRWTFLQVPEYNIPTEWAFTSMTPNDIQGYVITNGGPSWDNITICGWSYKSSWSPSDYRYAIKLSDSLWNVWYSLVLYWLCNNSWLIVNFVAILFNEITQQVEDMRCAGTYDDLYYEIPAMSPSTYSHYYPTTWNFGSITDYGKTVWRLYNYIMSYKQ